MAGVQGEISQLQGRLDDFVEMIERLDLSDLDLKPSFLEIKAEIAKLYRPLTELNFEFMSDLNIHHFNQAINEVFSSSQIVTDLREQETGVDAKSIIKWKETQTERVYDFINSLLRFIEFCNRTISSQQYGQIIDLANNAELIGNLKRELANFNVKNAEIALLLSSARTLSGKFIIEKYAEIFSRESRNFMYQAIGWLVLSIALLTTIVILGINNYNLLEPYLTRSAQGKADEINSTILLQLTINKILIASCLFFGLSITVKNYRWSRHNQTVNKHRQNAISTFEAYLESFKPDDQTRNAMLMEVARTIFGSQNTGFVDKDSEDSPTQIFEIFKPLANAGK